MTDGIEVTTGPLGQGIANAVGMAIGQAHFGALFNKPGFNLFDNFTYAFCGDGCLQEGISGEASSMAGHLGLGNLIVLYDDNNITIDGETDLSFTEDVPARYRSYGWQTLSVSGGDSNIEGILAAIQLAKTCSDKPTLISVKTTIGFGSSKAGTHGVHGAPLGNDDLAKTKAALGLDSDKKFNVSSDVYNYYAGVKQAGYEAEGKWNAMLEVYTKQYPELAAELTRRLAGKLPAGWKDNLPKYTAGGKAVATRNCSGAALKAIANAVPELVGGSADLTPSNKTQIKSDDFQKSTPHGRYFRFGVREHGMAAIGNGLNAYNNLIPFTATFLNFLEYLFPALRLTALSEQQQIFIMTHDSIALGEDGPTHQPIEALAICRATPNCLTFRPADGNETNGAYIQAMEATSSPSVLALTRQGLPQLAGTSQEKVALGGYVVEDCKGKPDVVFVATGSEVSLAIDAAKLLTGHKVRVVSMPCVELFERQSVAYRRYVS